MVSPLVTFTIQVEFEDKKQTVTPPTPGRIDPCPTVMAEYAPQEQQNYERLLRLMLKEPHPITTAVQQVRTKPKSIYYRGMLNVICLSVGAIISL